ncbi:MAG: GntR family transcriptional regulator, partial [Halanaerobium sp.]
QRAYREMEQRGLVETRRGRGTFIKDNDQVMIEIKKEMAESAVANFIEQMLSLGFNKEKILKKVETNLQRRENID